MAAFASSRCFFLVFSTSLVIRCQPSQRRAQRRVCVPVTIRLSKFMQPFLQLRNVIQRLRATPYRLSSGTTQSCLSDLECEYLPSRRSRRSILDSDEQRSKIANVNYRPRVPGEFLVTACIPAFNFQTTHVKEPHTSIRTLRILRQPPWGYGQGPRVVCPKERPKSNL